MRGSLAAWLKSERGNLLEDHVGDGGFVENAEVVFVDHDEGGVSAAFGVEEDLRRPGFTVVS